ncbi:hypothetical protein [Corynebacterium gerontici]|uniref:Uncharacterized protein n=1 Tax=Corynebacterium gerontici TaxID=2079234 RepID=A0A3G6J375_9CORY|nr:hypothetical protein [Corynebacterium gerontici]AZA12366.1 hypothetical protein CGERO_10430 [Corynebacterium gerontici]
MTNQQWGNPRPQNTHRAPILALVAIVAILGVAVVWLLVKGQSEPTTDEATPIATQTIANSATETEKVIETAQAAPDTQDRCSLREIHDDEAKGWINKVVYCDGEWLVAGQDGTERIGHFHWEGSWQIISSDGRVNGYHCFNSDTIKNLGAPAGFRQLMVQCDEGPKPKTNSTLAQAAESPACNGQYILILESVIQYEYDDLDSKLSEALAKYPGAKYTKPGACSSLRGNYNGGYVYPIYYSYGRDVAALCQAKAKFGGNARSLNNNSDFSDPC